MNRFIRFLFLFFVILSCNKEEIEVVSKIDTTMEPNIIFLSDATTQSLTFTSNEPWKIVIQAGKSEESWLKFSKMSGDAGTVSVEMEIAENPDYDDRTMNFAIEGGTAKVEFSVLQRRKGAIVTDQGEHTIDYRGDQLTINVSASVEFDVVIPSEYSAWIVPVGTKALVETQREFTIKENLLATRNGQIIFKQKDAKLADTVRIIQTGKSDVLAEERAALLEFYEATNGSKWMLNNGWGVGEVSNAWKGIYLNEFGHVRKIKLPNNNLDGALPASFGHLKQLQELELNGNKLRGLIPERLQTNPFFEQFVFNIIRQTEGYGFELDKTTYKVPSFTFTDVAGATVNSKEFFAKNKLTVLYLWNSKSGPSNSYSKEMFRLREKYKSKGLEVLGFSSQLLTDINLYLTQIENLPWQHIQDKEYYFRDKLNAGMYSPGVIVVDQDGVVQFDVNRSYKTLGTFLEEKLGAADAFEYYSSTDYSQDGQYITLQTATKGKGVNLVITADAFIDKDFLPVGNSKWDSVMNAVMRHFFSVEPAKSYREYFNVYAVKAISKNGQLNDEYYTGNKTVFETKIDPVTSKVDGNMDLVNPYLSRIPGVEQKFTAVCIIMNDRRHAGVCKLNNLYGSYSILPMSAMDVDLETGLRKLVHHEFIGHGFARADDEYINNYVMIPDNQKAIIVSRHSNWNMSWNLSLTTDPSQAPWKELIGQPNYDMVRFYEGGFNYSQGIWRSEPNSCLNNNVPYFSAIIRLMFVRNLMFLAGEEFTLEKFMANDKYEPIDNKMRFLERPLPHQPVEVIN